MLLDTHILLYFLNNDRRSSDSIKLLIEEIGDVFVSVISLWEIAIKHSIGKLSLDFELRELPGFLEQLEIQILPLTFTDIEQFSTLPFHHRDPCDRMLIAQAIARSLVVVSADPAFEAYPVQRIWDEA
ncbi:MAG: type II toxin-antitoxin system VapC family toxin [Spirulinaceae cyanobacterium]